MNPDTLTDIFSSVAAVSWRASWLILALVVVRRLVRGRIPAQVWFAVWIVVALRLLLPVSLPASWSPFNFLPRHTAAFVPSPTLAAPMPVALPASPAAAAAKPESPAPREPQENALPVTAATLSPMLTALPEPVAAETLSWTEIATALWVAGVAILALARLLALARFQQRLRKLRPTTDSRLADTVAREACQFGGTGAPVCLETEAVDAPALFGLRRPRLLFPPGLAAQLTDHELRLVVRHELAHWRRRDLLAQALMQAAAILHWFNPLAWCAARMARNDCELACDEFVLRRETASGATAYGSTLLKVLGVTPRLRRRPAASVGIFESKQQLAQRLRTIAGYRAATRVSIFGGIALVGVLATASLTRESRAAASASPTTARAAAPRASDRNVEREQVSAEALPAFMENERKIRLDRAIADAQTELRRTQSAMVEPEKRFAEIKERRQKKQLLAELPYIASDPRVIDVRRVWEKQKAALVTLSGFYTDESHLMKAALSEAITLEQNIERAAEIVAREIEDDYLARERVYVAAKETFERTKQLLADYRRAAIPSASTYLAQMQTPSSPDVIGPATPAPAGRSTRQPSVQKVDRRALERAIVGAQRELRAREEEFQAARNEANLARSEAEKFGARWNQLRAQQERKKPLWDLNFIADQPLVIRLKQELVNGRIEGAALRGRHGDSHPDVVALGKRMEQISLELDRAVATAVEQIEADYRTASFNVDLAGERQDMAKSRLQVAEDQLDKIQALIDTEVGAVADISKDRAESSAVPRPSGDFVIRIMGAVNQQGTVAFSAQDKPIVLDVIAHAGGFAANAHRGGVRVLRAESDGARRHIALTEEQIMSGDMPVKAGDIIMVPERAAREPRFVTIIGAVNKPGRFELPEEGAAKMTLVDLLAQAGGHARIADLKRIRITRSETDGRKTTVMVSMAGLEGRGSDGASDTEWSSFGLRAGDMVYVPERIL